MSRSRREPKIPKWAVNHRLYRHVYFATANPPPAFRSMWRRQARVRQKQAIQQCADFAELQIETKIAKLTCIYDWY
jgi:hypothetical protein